MGGFGDEVGSMGGVVEIGGISSSGDIRISIRRFVLEVLFVEVLFNIEAGSIASKTASSVSFCLNSNKFVSLF